MSVNGGSHSGCLLDRVVIRSLGSGEDALVRADVHAAKRDGGAGFQRGRKRIDGPI